MELQYFLITYVLLFIFIFFTLLYLGCDILSTLIFVIILMFLYILLLSPPGDNNVENENISYVAIYYFIILISFLAILFYSTYKACIDVNKSINLYKVN